MFPRASRRSAALLLAGFIVVVSGPASAEPPPADVNALLQKEPINKENWSKWRPRLREWSGEYYEAAEPAFKAAAAFAKGQLDAKGNLKAPLNKSEDAAVLYMCLGGDTLLDPNPDKSAVL